jgi:hypothetical protein
METLGILATGPGNDWAAAHHHCTEASCRLTYGKSFASDLSVDELGEAGRVAVKA